MSNEDFPAPLGDASVMESSELSRRVKYLEDDNAKLKARVGELELEREAEKAQISDNEDLRGKLVELGDEFAKIQHTIEWARIVLPKYHQGERPAEKK